MKLKTCLLLTLSLFLVAASGFCQEPPQTCPPAKVVFGFEDKVPSWEIPDWCFEKEGYGGESVAISTKFAKEGQSSLELMVNLSGGKWTAGYVEVQQYFDWTAYKTLSVDVYLPKDAPFGLQSRFIFTVGQDWTWTEMARLTKLVPGEWTTVSVNLAPGSTDWRGIQITDQFRADIRKMGIRVESNMKPVYSGPVYIDNVRLE